MTICGRTPPFAIRDKFFGKTMIRDLIRKRSIASGFEKSFRADLGIFCIALMFGTVTIVPLNNREC